MTAINKTSMTVITIVTVAVSILVAILQSPLQQKLYTDLYGREREQEQLLNTILGESNVIELVGIAGVGKTKLILNTVDKLINEHGYCAIYIDVSEYNSSSSLIAHLVNDQQCLSILSIIILRFAELYNAVNLPLQSWCKALKLNTVLIFDSADDLVDEMDEVIIEPFLATKAKAKIVRISRFNEKKFLMRTVFQLQGMTPTICAKWITSEYDQISVDKGNELCYELGGIPQAVISIVEYLRSNTSEKIGNVIAELKNSHYGKAFAYLQSIIEANSTETNHQIKAIHLLYEHLTYEHKLCLWLLVDMKGSYTFTKNMAEHHLQDINTSANDCLEALLKHSFIETKLDTQKQFKFHPYVRKFIQLLGEPEGDTTRNSAIAAKAFYGNYVYSNAKELHFQLENTQNLQLAIQIGSNQRLVNSFLPILGEKFDLKPLFKIALKVIEGYYCKSSGILYGSSAKALLAFSYLTKALYCPSIHPPSLLLPTKPKLVQKSKKLCLQMLASCPAILFIGKDEKYQSIEALGYHNSLLIYAHDSAPWWLSLRDVSLIVTVADDECVQYCKINNKCYCGRKSSLEHGLREHLLGNYQLSTTFFQTTLTKLSGNDQQCQTILKILAIIGIHRSQTDFKTPAHVLLKDINLDDLDLSCFLGVLNDIIVPFLLEINQLEPRSILLAKRLSKAVSEEDKQCNTELETDEEKLDCTPRIRYTIAHGLTALRLKELKDKLKWPQRVAKYHSREEWVCSVIRDKTTTCEKTLPLISQVRSIETNKNYKHLWVLKYFMNEKNYKQLEQRAKKFPRFFQKMSI